jgi:hypothetical protein
MAPTNQSTQEKVIHLPDASFSEFESHINKLMSEMKPGDRLRFDLPSLFYKDNDMGWGALEELQYTYRGNTNRNYFTMLRTDVSNGKELWYLDVYRML